MARYLIYGNYVDEKAYQEHRQKQLDQKVKAQAKTETPKASSTKESK